MSLALSTLIYEWRRYLAAVIALALAGVLMLALSGLFVGLLSSFTAVIDRSRGSLIIMMADASSMQGASSALPARVLPLIYRHSDVVEVRDIPGDFGQLYAPGATEPKFVNIMVVDTAPDSVTLPVDFSEEVRLALSVPFNMAVDASALKQLGVKVGDEASLNGRTVRVAALLQNYPNMQAPNVVVSRQTQRLMGRANDAQLGQLMVRIKNPAEAERVRDELNAIADGQYRAWTKKELSDETLKEVMQEGLIAMMMGFASTLGFIIGVAITWQTLRGAILANIKEFASLRALGVSMGDLRLVIMELSFWVGVAGVAMAAVFMTALTGIAGVNGIPMGYQPASLMQTGVLLLIIAVGSGALTLGALNKGEPSDLLR
ncbi:MAG: ABC transporter permease [Alphaproteobacteria bacterium]|nr:ABC transporter permease [Alphaproteobacteria bacterium]